MAYTNLHKNLPDREIHPPKKFNTASSSSVLTKSLGNEVEWAGASYTVEIVITCSADVSGITGGRYFILPLKNITYQVWFDVDNGDSCLINSRHTGLEIDISANDTASTIASALKTELNAISGVTAVNASEKVTITIDADTVSVSAPQDGPAGSNTGYKFVTSRTSTGDEYLATDSSGNISWEAKPKADFVYQFSAYTNVKKGGDVGKWSFASATVQPYLSNGPTALSVFDASLPTTNADPLKAQLGSFFHVPHDAYITDININLDTDNASTRVAGFALQQALMVSGSTSAVSISKMHEETSLSLVSGAVSNFNFKDISYLVYAGNYLYVHLKIDAMCLVRVTGTLSFKYK